MTDQWPSKKEYENALRNINLRLDSLTAGAAGGEMIYTTAATDIHSGGGAYETVVDLTGEGQAILFTGGAVAQAKYQNLKITVDGTAVITDLIAKVAGEPAATAEGYWGVWNFDTSLKIEHKSDSNVALVRVAYCCV
jgi:hypothetical protein